jgi:hypothetical protein
MAASCFADGKLFRFGVAEMPPIPDQQAIIAWDGATSTETLAIETRFAAPSASLGSMPGTPAADQAAAYAWVVPLPGPGAPKITAATTGLFPTVRSVFLPRVDDRQSPESITLSIPIAALLVIYFWLRAAKRRTWAILCLLIPFALACFGVLLPSLGKARLSAGSGAWGVELLERSIVGSYEVAVVGVPTDGAPADSGRAIAGWLSENGFQIPAAASLVLADYAARKWVFAAVKLRPDPSLTPGLHLTPHPLVFRFSTPRAVYPMALTGVGNSPLTLDLYVFGYERAAAPGLREIRCDQCDTTRYESPRVFAPESCVPVVHPGLAEIVGKLTVATKLSGTLAPAAQAKDMDIAWSGFSRSGSHKFSPHAALMRALEFGFGAVPLAIVGIFVVAGVRSAGPVWASRRLVWAPVLGVIVGLGTYAVTPTVPARVGGRHAARMNHSGVTRAIPQRLALEFGKLTHVPSLEEAGAIAAAYAKEMAYDTRAEDSPGNYILRHGKRPGSIEYVAFDATGAAKVETVWEP